MKKGEVCLKRTIFCGLIAALALILCLPQLAFGGCSEHTQGPIMIQAEQCSVVDPKTKFSAKDSLPTWVLEMDKAAIARFMATYRGVLITGTVKKSSAISRGLINSNQGLKGTVITVFSPGQVNGCAGLINNPIQGQLTEECCDGGGQVPCLLAQKYLLNEIKVAAAAVQTPMKLSDDYAKGRDFFNAGQFQKAAPLLKKAYKANQLDNTGKWIFGRTLEAIEDCPTAIRPLSDIQKSWVKGDTSGTEDKFVGSALLLLARCLSRSSKAAPAVGVLNLLLAQPRVFRKEINIATFHQDFGWINTTSEYRNYLENAKRALNK